MARPTISQVLKEALDVVEYCNESGHAYPAALLGLCVMNALGGLREGCDAKNEVLFKKCIGHYFPQEYQKVEDQLWIYLRCELVHKLIAGSGSSVSCEERSVHAHLSQRQDWVFINTRQLYSDLQVAVDKYLAEYETSPSLKENAQKCLKQELQGGKHKQLPSSPPFDYAESHAIDP